MYTHIYVNSYLQKFSHAKKIMACHDKYWCLKFKTHKKLWCHKKSWIVMKICDNLSNDMTFHHIENWIVKMIDADGKKIINLDEWKRSTYKVRCWFFFKQYFANPTFISHKSWFLARKVLLNILPMLINTSYW
jgi:hypothetical protein